MEVIILLFIVALAVVVDFFWFDINGKRWGWMKSWTKLQKGIFFSCFAVVSVLVYLGLGVEFF
ncbi:hypothetical protein [Rossellomorea vietnamensis]|uniref:hypothetical protein n=1 Tax=Rossellomorea vietnamensis TaxID=218284 RepID=UPI001E4CC2E4|nr:hypothetical protein [Rossellomorea vietnamensis]MCC5801171.1 hypothetical protein [Rossellomorea vietnamensis]